MDEISLIETIENELNFLDSLPRNHKVSNYQKSANIINRLREINRIKELEVE